jgi:hypothetical protein
LNGLDTELQAFVNAVDELKVVILNKAWSDQLNKLHSWGNESFLQVEQRTKRTVEQFGKLEFSI